MGNIARKNYTARQGNWFYFAFFPYEVNQALDFNRPKENLPAWQDQKEFIEKLDESRLLIVKALTGSGKTTIFLLLGHVLFQRDLDAFAAHKLEELPPKVFCTGTRRMWGLHETNKIVGFQHGLENSSPWDSEETRILFLTEGIIMRQAMKVPDVNSHFSVIDGCVVLMLDEVQPFAPLRVEAELSCLHHPTYYKSAENSKIVKNSKMFHRPSSAGQPEARLVLQKLPGNESAQAWGRRRNSHMRKSSF